MGFDLWLNNKGEKILVFVTSYEPNGIITLKDYWSEARPETFFSISSYVGLLKFLQKYGRKCSPFSIYALSDPHFIFAKFAVDFLRLEVPVVLGVYHPRQFEVTLDQKWSSTRARVFRRLMSNIDDKNIVFNTKEAANAARDIFPHIGVRPNLIAGPPQLFPFINRNVPASNKFEIITVGRFVDFKISTILSMISVVEKLEEEGHSVVYDIYGEGPAKETLRIAIENSKSARSIKLLGKITLEEFPEIVGKYDLFWGMGAAVIQSASIGIPSLVAIQGEDEALTYGLVSDFDHYATPVFGDPDDTLERKCLYQETKAVILANEAEWAKIGQNCSEAVYEGYGPAPIFSKLIRSVCSARQINGTKVSFFDVGLIRLETYFSRFKGRKTVQT